MFIGHFALGFAAKRVAPRTPLALLMVAPFLLDLVFAHLVLLGWEQIRLNPAAPGFLALEPVSMPFSHSLMGSVGWALLLALPYFAWRRDGRGAMVLALLVVSHWVLDAVTHRPDMALFLSGGPQVGLGLWYSRGGTLIVEGGLFAWSVWLYASITRATSRMGDMALSSLVGLFVVMYLGFVFGPPPPNGEALAYLTLTGWSVPFWALWIERHRALVAAESPGVIAR